MPPKKNPFTDDSFSATIMYDFRPSEGHQGESVNLPFGIARKLTHPQLLVHDSQAHVNTPDLKRCLTVYLFNPLTFGVQGERRPSSIGHTQAAPDRDIAPKGRPKVSLVTPAPAMAFSTFSGLAFVNKLLR